MFTTLVTLNPHHSKNSIQGYCALKSEAPFLSTLVLNHRQGFPDSGTTQETRDDHSSPSRVHVQSPNVSKPSSSTDAAALSCGETTLKGWSLQLLLWAATPGDIMEIEEISAESDYKEPGSSGTQANSGEAEFKQTELRPEPPGKGFLG